jgi:hypothetical protein
MEGEDLFAQHPHQLTAASRSWQPTGQRERRDAEGLDELRVSASWPSRGIMQFALDPQECWGGGVAVGLRMLGLPGLSIAAS